MSYHEEPLALDCYVRGGTLPSPTKKLVKRMQNLEGGPVHDVAIHGWPSTLSLTDSPHERELNVYKSFVEWATDRGVSLRPSFDIRDVTSLITSESTRELVMPVLAVGVYTHRHLIGVFPHTTETRTYTVEDLVSALETGVTIDEVSPAVGSQAEKQQGRHDTARDSELDTSEAGAGPDVPELQ